MTWFRRNSSVAALEAKVAELNLEAVEMAKATQAMADHNHREHQRLERRIAGLLAAKDSLYQQNDGLTAVVRGLREALAAKQAEVDTALAEVKNLDGKLVAAETDLGREREDHRAFRRAWAGHLNACPVAQELHEEDIAKARSR